MDETEDDMLYKDMLKEDLVPSSTDEDEDEPTIRDNKLNDDYDMTNDDNAGLTDEQMMRLFDSDDDSEKNSLDSVLLKYQGILYPK